MGWLQTVSLGFFYLILSVCESNGYYEPGVDSGLNTDTVIFEKAPGNEYDHFPLTYAVWFEYEGEAFFYELVKDDKLTRSLNPSIFKLATFLPDDLMTDENDQFLQTAKKQIRGRVEHASSDLAICCLQEFAYYHNSAPVDSQDRVDFVLHRQSAQDNAKFYGKFSINGKVYFVEHIQEDMHRIQRRETTEPILKRKRRASQVVPGDTCIVETFVWSAPDVFKFHRKRLGSSARRTEEFLRVWERSIIRDADLIFKRMVNTTDIRLYYMGGGNDRDTNIAWYADNIQGRFIRQQAAEDFKDYLSPLVQVGTLPSYDHVVILTRQDLADNDFSSGRDKIAFALDEPSVCTPIPGCSVSMAEVMSPFFIKAVAQSILFAFGIPYNSASPYTVMSRTVDTNVPTQNRADRWTVDRQSANRLRRAIAALSFNCMKIQNPLTDFDNFTKEPTYGAKYNINEQCQIFAGDTSTPCRDMGMICYNGEMCRDSNGDCTLDYFTGDRTQCGNDDVFSCRYGDCAFQEISTTTPASTTTSTPMTTTDSNLQSTTPLPCCCETRPLGQVVIDIEYVPCQNGKKSRYAPYYSP